MAKVTQKPKEIFPRKSADIKIKDIVKKVKDAASFTLTRCVRFIANQEFAGNLDVDKDIPKDVLIEIDALEEKCAPMFIPLVIYVKRFP